MIKRHKEQGWCPHCQAITWQEITEWESTGKLLIDGHCLKCHRLLYDEEVEKSKV